MPVVNFIVFTIQHSQFQFHYYYNFTFCFQLIEILCHSRYISDLLNIKHQLKQKQKKPLFSSHHNLLEYTSVKISSMSGQGQNITTSPLLPSPIPKNRQPPAQQEIIQEQSEESNSVQHSVQISIDINSIMSRLLELSQFKPGKKADIREEEIYGIVNIVRQIVQNQSMLLEIEAPVLICGDIHGQYYDLLRLFHYGELPPNSTYLFLGDYVDRGQYGIETICLLFCLKIKYPDKIYLLRGNHQSASISKIYGFYNQCKKRYSVKIWKLFLSCFVHLPVSAIVSDRIICMHGGLSPEMSQISDINQIIRPQEVPDQGILCDLLWADPTTATTGWAESERGCSYVFGSDVSSSFLKYNNLDLICRAHQVVEDGYEFCHKKRVVTLFSAPNYCGQFNNAGAFMRVDANLNCSFHILLPDDKTTPFKNSRSKSLVDSSSD